MTRRQSLMGLGIACLIAGLASASPEKTKQLITVKADRAEFLRQEPILITLRVEGETATGLPNGLDAESPSTALRFEIEPNVKPRKGARPLPGERGTEASKTRVYDLLEWFEFPESGRFTVRAVYENGGNPISSAAFAFSIVAPKKGEPEFEAVARIHHIPWSNYEANAYCGDTFDVVKRWPQSRLAPYCQYWNGRHWQQKKEFDKAIASYSELIARYPDFALTPDAKRAVEVCRGAIK
jgi:hypothetical protein